MAPQRTTAVILAAARESIIEHGLQATTVSEIARRANISRMTVYRRWSGADELALELVAQDIRDKITHASSLVPPQANGRQRLIETILLTIPALDDDELFRALRIHNPEVFLPSLTSAPGRTFRVVEEQITRLLRKGIADGSIRDLDVALAAHMLTATSQAILLSADAFRTPQAYRRALIEVSDMIASYLVPRNRKSTNG